MTLTTDHCIVTNFEGDIAIYRGLDLEELIRDVAFDELDDEGDSGPEVLKDWQRVTNLESLTLILNDRGIDIFYDAPRTY